MTHGQYDARRQTKEWDEFSEIHQKKICLYNDMYANVEPPKYDEILSNTGVCIVRHMVMGIDLGQLPAGNILTKPPVLDSEPIIPNIVQYTR